MMGIRKFTALAFLLFALGPVANLATSQQRQPAGDVIGPESHIVAPPSTYRFPDGQVYVYTGEWRLWTAGTATLRIESTGPEQKVTVTADSSGVVSVLFGVHDHFEAYFDPKTFCSDRIFKRTQEGFHRRDTNIKFDYLKRKAILDEVNLKNNQKKHTEEDIPSCATDVISGIYYLASLPLKVGSAYTFPVNDGGKTADVRAQVEARESIKTEAGTFQTVRVHPENISPEAKNRGAIWIWYTDDAAHIPVQMRARAFWGSINVRLIRIEKK